MPLYIILLVVTHFSALFRDIFKIILLVKNFFYVDHFENLRCICYHIASVLCFVCLVFFFFGQEACRILAPWPGIEPSAPALGAEILTSRLPRKSPCILILILMEYSRLTVLLVSGVQQCDPVIIIHLAILS